MKTLICILTVIFAGCNNLPKKNAFAPVHLPGEKKQPSIDKAAFYATSDSVVIASKHFDTIVYSREDFNEIIDNFPALYDSIPVNPDISYLKSQYNNGIPEAESNKKNFAFGSEAGQDEYYILYSYFLKKKNEGNDLETRRETLISIYQDINGIFQSLRYGGTFFGHQFNRINGYAEYDVYQYKAYMDHFNKLPEISGQKKLYLASIKQIIIDETKMDNEIPVESAKEKRQKELFKYVEHLNSLISDNFYLKKAQEFQYSNY